MIIRESGLLFWATL